MLINTLRILLKKETMKKHLLLLFLFISILGYSQGTVEAKIGILDGGARTLTFKNPAPIAYVGTPIVSNTTGNGRTDGAVSIIFEGGSGGYDYNWTKNEQDFIPGSWNTLAVGRYTIQAKDKTGGCLSNVFSFTINQPEAIDVTIPSPALINCFGGTGNLTAQATGGFPYNAQPITRNYLYTWYSCDKFGGNATPISLPNADPAISGKLTGYYKVSVTDTKGNTPVEKVVFLDQNPKITVTPTINHVVCKEETGSISVTVDTGLGPFTIAWKYKGNAISSTDVGDNTSLTSTINNAQPGDYSYVLTGKYGCIPSTNNSVLTIQAPVNQFVATLNSKADPSPTTNNGTIALNVSGGYGNYTYSWKKDGIDFTPSNPISLTSLENGNYSVIVTDKRLVGDASGCPIEIKNIVLKSLFATINVLTPINCIGDVTTLEAMPIGGKGTASYTYEWFKGTDTTVIGTAKTLPNCNAGDYKVIVSDGKYSFTVNQNLSNPVNPPITVATSAFTAVNCYGGSDGTIFIQAKDGNPVNGIYSFTWNKPVTVINTSNSSTVTNLTAGTYIVTIKDQYCTKDVSFTISEPLSPITIAAPVIKPVLINGQSTGSIEFPTDPTGGTAGYEYKWTSSDVSFTTKTTKNISGLKAGSYTLEVTDANFKKTANNAGCKLTNIYTVTESDLLEVKITESAFIKCFNDSNGELKAEVEGGIAPYKYIWKYNGNVLTGKNTATISGLAFGNYSVSVTDTANPEPDGPFATAEQLNFKLKQPDELKVTLNKQTNVLCYGAATGAIEILITGGTAPYTQQWTKNGANYSNVLNVLPNLTVGNYNVIVTDALGHSCTKSLAQDVVITQPAAPLKIESVTPINLTGFETNNGSITVTVSGGKANYNYQWTKDTNPAVVGSGPAITGLSIGIYHLNVTDANGCTLPQVDYEITQPDKLEIISITQSANTSIACFGDSPAEYRAVVRGGVKEYVFEWLNTTTGLKYTSVENISATSTASKASNLPAGNYVISIKDAQNNILFGTNTFTILQPDKLTFSYTKTNVSCFEGNNGTIKLTISGGTKFTDIAKPYTIVSSGKIDTQNGIISELTQGTYTVKVIDANGCQTDEQTVIITEPANSVFINNKTITPTTGFGLSTGKIVITVAGGTAGYKYQWKNNLDIVVGTNSPTLSNIPAGIYSVLVTDANTCTTSGTYTVEQPTKPVLTETHIQARCNGLLGSLDAIATGGATFGQNQSDRNYTYKLRNKTTNAVVTIVANTAKFENIADGDYTLTATDLGGVDSNSIDVVFKQPTPIVVNLDSKLNVSCFDGQDGSIVISVTGGTPFVVNSAPVYNYQWKKKNKTTNTYENFTPTALNTLTEGIYAVEVRDANYNSSDINHCVGILDEIVVTQPADFGFDIDKITYVNPTAQNGNDGALHFEIKGGKTNYEYKIYTKNTQGNETVLQTISNTSVKTVDFTNLIKDHYYVSVQDDTGCIKYADFDFIDNPLTITISQTQDMTCFESNNAIIKASVNGGFGIKKITWYRDNVLLLNENNAELTNVKIGNYYAVVKDSKSIEVTTAPIIITQPNLVTFTTVQEPVKCLGDSNGTISITATGGNGTFRYRYFQNGTLVKDWANFVNGAKTVIANLADGEYAVQVQDTQQCKSADATVKITSPTALEINTIVAVPATGKGLSNGSIAITALGANGSYSYNWFKSDGTNLNQTTAKAINLAAGKYYIIVTDAKGCNLTSSLIEVTEPPLLETTISVQNVVLCNGDKNGSLKPTTTGGLLNPGETYTYQWFENGNTAVLATSAILNNIGKGSYYVIAKDSNGNLATSQILVVTEPNILNNVLTADYVNCGDFNDWTINATPSGGTLPYTYIWNTGSQTATIQNVKPGNYSVLVTDNHGCNITKTITVDAPAHLDAKEVIKIPTCYAGSDATIVVTPIDGTAPYKYLWNTGEKTNQLSNASAGEYSVEITDARGCSILRSYTIVNPPKDIINLGEDVTLCFDQTLTINATIDDDKATYSWTSDKGFKSNKAMITVSQAANYTVVVTNKLGCEAIDTIKISSQSTAISAEFAVSSQVFKNEKFIIVDISNPAADDIEWILPANATIVSKNKDFAEISFSETGEYDITMNTKKGDCTAYQTKTILVTEGDFEENNPDEVSKKFDLKIYPNPSKGTFTVDVILDKVIPAHVKVYSLNNNVLIDSKTQDGKDNYLFNFSFNGLPSGVYFVLFESQQGSKLRKIIIQ